MLVIIGIVVVVVILIGAGAALALNGKKSPSNGSSGNNSNNSTTSQTSQTPGASPTPTTPPASGNAPAGFKQYSASLFSIDYPSDWTLAPSDQTTGTTSITGAGEIFQVDVENSGDENVSQYLTLYCQALSESAGSPTTVTIGGQQWQQLVCENNGQPAATAEGITYKGHVFTINYFTLSGDFASEVTQYFHPMEQSFAFLG